MSDPTHRLAAYEEALLTIARATVTARRRTHGFNIPPDAAQTLLADCEHALTSLVALGAVPGQPDPGLPSVAQRASLVPRPGEADHTPGDGVPTRATVDLMLTQLHRDRGTAYWGSGRHAGILDGAEAWLLSLRDWLIQ